MDDLIYAEDIANFIKLEEVDLFSDPNDVTSFKIEEVDTNGS